MSFGGSHWCRSTPDFEHRSMDFNQNRSTVSPEHRSTTPTELTASCNVVRIMTHEEFTARHPHPPSPVYVNIDRQTGPAIDRQRETAIDRQPTAPIDRQPTAPIDRRAPLTYRVQIPKIDVAHLNALRPRPNPSRSSGGIVRDVEVQIGNALVPVDFHVLDIKLNWNSSLLLGIAFTLTVGAVCNMRTNQSCITHIDPHVYYNPIPVMKQQASSRRIDNPRLIAPISPGDWENDYYNPTMAAHTRDNMHTEEYDEDYEAERAIEYRAILDEEDRLLHHSSWKWNAPSSGGIVRDVEVQIGNALVPVDFHVLDIKLNWNSSLLLGIAFTLTVGAVCNMRTNQSCITHIDPHVYYNPIPVMKQQASSRRIDNPRLIAPISPGDWENDYYNPTMAAHTRDNMHTEEYDEDYEAERAIEYRAILDEEDRLLHHSSWKWNAPSIDRTISTSIDTHLHQTSRQRASTDIAYYPSIDTGVDRVQEGDYSIGSWADNHYHESYAVETAIHEPRAENLFMQQRNSPAHQQRVTREIYNAAGGVDDRFKQKSRQHTRPSIDVDVPSLIDIRPEFGKKAYDRDGTRRFHWEENDEYGVYRDDQGHAREPQEMSTATYVFQNILEKNEGAFQMKLDGVYYPLNDSISWLTTCMEEMRQDITRIQTQRTAEATTPQSID
ncbi:hypothetical protein F2Q69_00023317 [Brassica cretica]|uniref:Uncharacterized protein n=1 Tax=Brassica cretica TaxID=69181 RepID=A0A8S9QKH5_BRACR|nr:hypothetical protein F2Q69_00023317 [Brassica cretica]